MVFRKAYLIMYSIRGATCVYCVLQNRYKKYFDSDLKKV